MSVTTESTRNDPPELLAWDTEFWGIRIGRGSNAHLDEWARENMVGCMCLLIPAHDQEEIHLAEQRGYRVMDVRVKYQRITERQGSGDISASRRSTPGDFDFFSGLARRAFRGLTRFYADPEFEDDRCDDLYEGWFQQNVASPAVSVLAVNFERGPAGFVTVALDNDCAAIELIAVAEHARGWGIGRTLARAATYHAAGLGIPQISVVTQGCNIPAQRAFQKAGYRLVSTDVWLHKWFA